LKGLEYLHKIGVTHTDIRAENILVLEDNSDIIKLIDFGAATWDHEYHSSLINTR
jgi:serine/threonine protein kinase